MNPACLYANLSFDAVTIDEYFVGAGDINAGHLPKQDAVVKSEPAPSTGAAPTTELVQESTEAKSDPSDTSANATETAVETETSTTAPTDATVASADATTAPSRETSEEKEPEEKGEEKKAELTVSAVPASGKPGKVKPRAPVMDDNDNELRHILEVIPCCFDCFLDHVFHSHVTRLFLTAFAFIHTCRSWRRFMKSFMMTGRSSSLQNQRSNRM